MKNYRKLKKILQNQFLRVHELDAKLNDLNNIKDDKQMHKMKLDVIWKANNKGFKIKQSTLDKYGIKFNEETKEYY